MDPIVYIPIKLGTINWERKPSIVPSEAGPEIDTMIASLGDNLYQAEYLSNRRTSYIVCLNTINHFFLNLQIGMLKNS